MVTGISRNMFMSKFRSRFASPFMAKVPQAMVVIHEWFPAKT
jgi:hypothetical protein